MHVAQDPAVAILAFQAFAFRQLLQQPSILTEKYAMEFVRRLRKRSSDVVLEHGSLTQSCLEGLRNLPPIFYKHVNLQMQGFRHGQPRHPHPPAITLDGFHDVCRSLTVSKSSDLPFQLWMLATLHGNDHRWMRVSAHSHGDTGPPR